MSEAKRNRRKKNQSSQNLKRFAINCHKLGTVMNKDLAEFMKNALEQEERANTPTKETTEEE